MNHPAIIAEVPGLFRVVRLSVLRRTEGVHFDALDPSLLPRIDAIDRVLHAGGAVSPGSVEGVARPWYMHPYQDDNLLVLHGTRYVEIYSPSHGKVEQFTVTPCTVEQQGEVLIDEPAMLVWPRNVFHRIRSCDQQGSASINFAVHHPGMDKRTNFNIYDLNTETGQYYVLRPGYMDQPGAC